MGRILLFTGKGGVGKTSVAAAHGRYSALEGYKTLVVSTDMAHNLSDIYQVPVGREIQQVTEHLDVLEIDPYDVMETDFKDMSEAMLKIMASSGLPLEELEQLPMYPGEEELFSLLKILKIHNSGAYDRIIVDCAPTGETLSLLKFPEMMSWYMEKFFPVGRVAMRVLAPISKAVFKVELPDKNAMSDIEKAYVRMIELQELLKDRDTTSIRLVAMPEKMVVEETKRNFMYMNMYNFHVDGIYINRILPKDISNPFFEEWIDIQKAYIHEFELVFDRIPIYRIPWFDSDLNGLEGIDKIVDHVLRGRDVFSPVDTGKGEEYIKTANGYTLKLYLPCAGKGELNMHESGSDIIIKVGNFKRNIPKPGTLRNHYIDSAKFDDQSLEIVFVRE